MLKDSQVFAGFSVDNLEAAKAFYADILGVDVSDDPMGLKLNISSGNPIFIYAKEGHQPASYTILNFPVANIDAVVDDLTGRGVIFERYDNMPGIQDEKGILRGKAAGYGPDIAWFKDPAGNILSVLCE